MWEKISVFCCEKRALAYMVSFSLSTPLEIVAKAVGASPLYGISLHGNVQLQAIAVCVLWQDNLVP